MVSLFLLNIFIRNELLLININLDLDTIFETLDEIFRAYLKRNETGWTKVFYFNKVLEKYILKSQDIFNYLINNPTIQYYEVMVGNFYKNGFGIDKNENKAFEWYMKASEKGDINGHYEVGYCYNHGYGIEKNHEKSFEFYQLAANSELNIALKKLADFYQYIEENKFKAFELYKKSAENGFIPSQYELANCYKDGKGIQQNKNETLKWFKLYQENDGDQDVSSIIKYIEKEMVRYNVLYLYLFQI